MPCVSLVCWVFESLQMEMLIVAFEDDLRKSFQYFFMRACVATHGTGCCIGTLSHEHLDNAKFILFKRSHMPSQLSELLNLRWCPYFEHIVHLLLKVVPFFFFKMYVLDLEACHIQL